MSGPRRWYIYLVSAIGLQAVAWAIIALLRNLLVTDFNPDTIAVAFQVAVIVVGLPVYLIHWLWAQRLARRDTEESKSIQRRLYLYGMQAGFLNPFVTNAYNLVSTLFYLPTGEEPRYALVSSPLSSIVYALIALVVLGVLWFYHRHVLKEDVRDAPETGGAATVRRLYVLGFSATGVEMTTIAIINLLRLIMFQIGPSPTIGRLPGVELAEWAAQLVVGLPLWLVFWLWAQRLFAGPDEEERESALRKFYLYLAVFSGVLGVVTNATLILGSFLGGLLDVPIQGDIRTPLSWIAGMALVWGYHAYVIQLDAKATGEGPRAAGVKRLYLYLVAAIGLAAFLAGVGGTLSVLIRSLDHAEFGTGLREQLAWFTATLIAGLPVWILPWRQAQRRVVTSETAEERRSLVRRIYLYFYLFIATMTMLSSAVFIVFKIVSLVLGEQAPTLSELGQPIAFSAIAVGVLLIHGALLRGDRQHLHRQRAQRLKGAGVAVVDMSTELFGQALADELRRELPDVHVQSLVLNQPTAELTDGHTDREATIQLSEAALIIGPWWIAVQGGLGGTVTSEIAQETIASPARKLLVPMRDDEWEWAGVDQWSTRALIRHTVRAAKQVLEGEEVKLTRPLSAFAIIGIICVVFWGLTILTIPLLILFSPYWW